MVINVLQIQFIRWKGDQVARKDLLVQQWEAAEPSNDKCRQSRIDGSHASGWGHNAVIAYDEACALSVHNNLWLVRTEILSRHQVWLESHKWDHVRILQDVRQSQRGWVKAIGEHWIGTGRGDKGQEANCEKTVHSVKFGIRLNVKKSESLLYSRKMRKENLISSLSNLEAKIVLFRFDSRSNFEFMSRIKVTLLPISNHKFGEFWTIVRLHCFSLID